jgi:hypothetical protein
MIYERLKTIWLSFFRLTFALLLAGIGTVLAYQAYSTISENMKKNSLRQYEIAKTWKYDLATIGFQATAKTKLVDDSLFLSIKLKGNPEFLNDPQLKQQNAENGFWIYFKDNDDFDVFSVFIPLSAFTTTIDKDGTPNGLSNQRREPLDADDYRRFNALKLGWTLETDLPQRPKASLKKDPQATDSSFADHCAPGLTRDARLSRLAKRGSVRETGYNTFSAGRSEIVFATDGAVIDCL